MRKLGALTIHLERRGIDDEMPVDLTGSSGSERTSPAGCETLARLRPVVPGRREAWRASDLTPGGEVDREHRHESISHPGGEVDREHRHDVHRPAGVERLRAQGYDPAMIEKQHGYGVQTLKFRGGMPFLGATRLFGLYRVANSMALLDAKLRGVGSDEAVGGRPWDSYTWHTDLPPGHPMVTGQQTVEFDLFAVENAKLVTMWGMNWTTTKMPDSHWLTEARMRGARVVVISAEYQATANKADDVIVLRAGTDAALALGVARIIIDEKMRSCTTSSSSSGSRTCRCWCGWTPSRSSTPETSSRTTSRLS